VQITEVRIKLMENSEDRLRGFCSITLDDCYVIRDLKIIEGNNGPFVAMPSRKLTAHCHRCRCKNHLRANYCNQCGIKLKLEPIPHDSAGRARLYADVAHPINARCREMIQDRVIKEFLLELDLAKQPGYVSRYDDDYESDWDADANDRQDQYDSSKKNIRQDSPVEGSVPEPHKSDQHDTISPSPDTKNNRRNQGEFGEGILD
jgi:stage V sporulation protein G